MKQKNSEEYESDVIMEDIDKTKSSNDNSMVLKKNFFFFIY